MTTSKLLCAALASAAVFAAAPASAEVFVFRFSAREIQTLDGRTEVLRRLDQEARSFCRQLVVRSYDTAHSAGKCRRELKAEILDEIGSADLIASR
jgi:UrcA family protein